MSAIGGKLPSGPSQSEAVPFAAGDHCACPNALFDFAGQRRASDDDFSPVRVMIEDMPDDSYWRNVFVEDGAVRVDAPDMSLKPRAIVGRRNNPNRIRSVSIIRWIELN